MSELIKRIAAEHSWQLEDDGVSGLFAGFPVTIMPGNGIISVFFYCPHLLQATREKIDDWLELNGRQLGFDSCDYSDDFYLVRLLNRGFRRASIDKIDQLIFVICNMISEDSSAGPYVCVQCGEPCTETGSLDGLFCYMHEVCPVEGEEGTTMDRTTYTYNDAVELIADLIRIPSTKGEPSEGAPFGTETVRALERFLEQAEQDGFRVGRGDGYYGYLEFGPEDGPLVAGVCHLDVVPIGEWADGFEPYVQDGRLVGRGSTDDKGPAVAVYTALKELKDAGFQPRCRLRLLLGLDEESGSACMKYYNEVDEAPVAAFTADAEFPVIHAEKGMFQFTISMDWEQQDTSVRRLVGARAGSRPNVIPGACTLTWQNPDGSLDEEVIEGVMGHASMPEQARNAISLAMEQTAAGLAASGSSHPFVDMYHQLIGDRYDGKGLGIASSDEVSGDLTFNAGILELDRTSATLVCDVRYPVTKDGEELVSTARQRVEAFGAELSLHYISEPLNLPKDDPLVSTLTAVYNEQTGSNAEPIAIGGGTYARSIANCVAFGPAFPGDPELAHQNGEYLLLDSFARSVSIYREAFRQLDDVYAN